MTQEEKQLLLKDLSARVPYGVKVTWDGKYPLTVTPHIYCAIASEDKTDNLPKLLLRPMSNMTEEESKEFALLQTDFYVDGILYPIAAINMVNWLNKKMFDYNGLIPMGLALEAPEGMYK